VKYIFITIVFACCSVGFVPVMLYNMQEKNIRIAVPIRRECTIHR